MEKGEIIMYQPDESIRLEVRMEDETVWLNLNQMSQLFGRDKSVISRHIRNVYMEGELLRESTVANFATVQDKMADEYPETLPPKEGIFYDGQIFDAYAFASELIRSAKRKIVLVDNYIDESVLLMLAKRNEHVTAEIVTGQISETLTLDIERHNRQYPPIIIRESDRYHDRFLIIDDTVYHIGASLKDLGKKLFAFNKMEIGAEEIGL